MREGRLYAKARKSTRPGAAGRCATLVRQYVSSSSPRRLNEYRIKPLRFTESGGYKFSDGWEVTVPGVKDV
jgi:hypothetical protein